MFKRLRSPPRAALAPNLGSEQCCPQATGAITDDTRIRAAVPTLKYLLDNGAKVLLASHFVSSRQSFFDPDSVDGVLIFTSPCRAISRPLL